MARHLPKLSLPRTLAPAAGIVIASLLHYFTPPDLLLWHNVFQRLYYLPIIYAAITFGWRGGVAASVGSALAYLPHILLAWHHVPEYAVNQYAEIIVFFLVGTTTGILADQSRRRSRQLEATTGELERVYRELQDSFEQIKRADRLSAIGQLAASLAHEIRNPLASIEGAANLIESPQTSDEVRSGSLNVIRKESRRLNRLLTHLLDFARPPRPEFQPVDVGRVIDSVIALVDHTARHQGIEVKKTISLLVPPVESDPEQIKQVLLNLTINAIQAMPQGGRIEISARAERSGVRLAVRDEGPGVSPEDLDRIFDPFYTTKDAGTGLGLSVAHQIVTQHRGTIKAERNAGGGMTFSLMLPVGQPRVSH